MGQIFTFYSYKGGVGRSMALANVAILLARWGKKVLIVDWDLEAPGIEHFFKQFVDIGSVAHHKGLIDLLDALVKHGRMSWSDEALSFMVPIPLPDYKGSVHLIPAGERTEDYFQRVRNLDVAAFYQEQNGGILIEELRTAWRDNYDCILVDSRTGITDIGGVCAIQLPDIIVLLFTPTEQSLNGILDVAAKAAAKRQALPFDRLNLCCLPIPSKFDIVTEHQESQRWLKRFANELSPLYSDWLPKTIERRRFLELTKIPYVPYFSFGEKLPVVEEGTSNPTSLGFAYETLAAVIGNELEALDVLIGDRTRFVQRVLQRKRSRLSQEEAYREMERRIQEAHRLEKLDLSFLELTNLPETLGQLTHLKSLDLSHNYLEALPESIDKLSLLESLNASHNQLTSLPASLNQLTQLTFLDVSNNELDSLPEWVAQFRRLKELHASDNSLSPELNAACLEGIDAIRSYFRSYFRANEAQTPMNEAKLILVGEGEVGKTSLLRALCGEPWVEGRPTTHGIEIRRLEVTDPASGLSITLNGWDFGGQQVYRPTHQLFFSAPAVYLVVWKPREGPQQGFVKDWIKLVKHREPEAKILVVATHGGPRERQPDIDRQEIWDLFGRDLVVGFFHVDSKPDKETQERPGIYELQEAIAKVAASLPEVGRMVPRRWQEARNLLRETDEAYMSLDQVLVLCRVHEMDDEEAIDFVRVSHRLGHLIHYEHDPVLKDIVILKPDWLTTAISFVFDDNATRLAHGLVKFSRLSQLWNDPHRPPEFRYQVKLHPIFLRLMERFDISYKVAIPSEENDAIRFWDQVGKTFEVSNNEETSVSGLHYTSLIAQLVPDIRPDPIPGWDENVRAGDREQVQICRITEQNSGQSAAAEGLFFQLIVRLHKYSLGRVNYADSVQWQRGLVLEDDYGARALLENVGNDVSIIVRSPYPEHFLNILTYEVKWLVENFWAGLRCDVMVPCLNPKPCAGLFEVRKLIDNRRRNRPEQPCPVCNEWQDIELLLHNAGAAGPTPLEDLLTNSDDVRLSLSRMRTQLDRPHVEVMGRFDRLEASSRELLSRVEAAYVALMQTLLDEAKDGPRLFSFEPIDSHFFDQSKWISEKFRITLWCEHSRLPLPALNGKGDNRGVYELIIPHDWFVKAAPFLKVLGGILSLVLPVAASATKLVLDDRSYKEIEKQLDLGQKALMSVLKGGQQGESWVSRRDTADVEGADGIRGQGDVLRQLHTWLKEKDPSYGGLVRVLNKRKEFLWVHPQFEQEY